MTAQGQCRENDTTLTIGDHDLVIEDVSLEREQDEREDMQDALLATSKTFSGSFDVTFDDEDDAKEFFMWLYRGQCR